MYAPGELSDPGELEALAAAFADAGALLGVHMRAYDAAGLVAAVDEILAVATATGARLQISHLRSTVDPDGAALDTALARIRASSADVAADAYPYLAGHTTTQQLMPPELRARGTAELLAQAPPTRTAPAPPRRPPVLFAPPRPDARREA